MISNLSGKNSLGKEEKIQRPACGKSLCWELIKICLSGWIRLSKETSRCYVTHGPVAHAKDQGC